MKKSIFGIVLVGLAAACSTSPTRDQKVQADPALLAKSFPSGSGTWHFANQWWDSGVHFCEYKSGRDKVISQIESYETCPAEVTAPSS